MFVLILFVSITFSLRYILNLMIFYPSIISSSWLWTELAFLGGGNGCGWLGLWFFVWVLRKYRFLSWIWFEFLVTWFSVIDCNFCLVKLYFGTLGRYGLGMWIEKFIFVCKFLAGIRMFSLNYVAVCAEFWLLWYVWCLYWFCLEHYRFPLDTSWLWWFFIWI